MKQGGGIVAAGLEERRRASVCVRFPWLGGAGPAGVAADSDGHAHLQVRPDHLVWDRRRASRSWRSCSTEIPPDRISSRSWASAFMAYLTFIFSMQLPWAFRGDIVHMDSLKSLPVAPLALCAGRAGRRRGVAGGDPVRPAGRLARRRRQPGADPDRRGFLDSRSTC